ncbi:hypothetical protein AVEN_30544-1 [Araneus ventricosus]|uniref:Uncharacterized protein n=1 Tax=Araneus ventricosus TaxID=182803 RepID=A0A4Y2KJX0_ARAVE|nr:hypothetical protein AVEN_30544-1 [Araneus ventricosus]
MDGNSYEELVKILSSFPPDVIDKICSKAKMLPESFDPAQSPVTSDSDAETDVVLIDLYDDDSNKSAENGLYLPNKKSFDNSKVTSGTSSEEIHSDEAEIVEMIQEDIYTVKEDFVQNSSPNDADLQSSSANGIPFPSSKSFDDLNGTSNTLNDGIETAEIILEDTSALQALYLINQQEAFDEFIKPNFPIKRLPKNAFCREWLLKHAECCLKGSMLEHSDNQRDFQISNQNDIPSTTIESDDNSHQTKNIVEEECDTVEMIQGDVPTLRDSAQNFLHKNTDLRSSTENEIPLPSSESFDNSHETSGTVGDEVKTVENFQEDTSAVHALYQENQKVSLDEFDKPKRRSPTNACRKWLSKHFFCCLRGSVLEHSDDNKDERDIRRISEFAEQRIFDNSRESRNMGSDDVVSSIRKSPTNACRKWFLNHVLCCLKN